LFLELKSYTRRVKGKNTDELGNDKGDVGYGF
jgi:hypothetical protein